MRREQDTILAAVRDRHRDISRTSLIANALGRATWLLFLPGLWLAARLIAPTTQGETIAVFALGAATPVIANALITYWMIARPKRRGRQYQELLARIEQATQA